jgi:anhydro-N-acetylmuramic acid kinase
MIQKYNIPTQDKLCTVCEHIAVQLDAVCSDLGNGISTKMLITGGGAYNEYLISRIRFYLAKKNVVIEIPNADLIEYKEALIMALIGVLRWREETNVLHSVTGASRSSIGGALWMGQE